MPTFLARAHARAAAATRRTVPAAKYLVARALPVLVTATFFLSVAATEALAQQGGKDVDSIIDTGKKWIIGKLIPLAGGAVFGLVALGSSIGDHHGMSKMGKCFLSILAGLAAAAVINLAQGWVQ